MKKSQSKKILKRDFSSKVIVQDKFANMKTPPQKASKHTCVYKCPKPALGPRSLSKASIQTANWENLKKEKSQYWALRYSRASRGSLLQASKNDHLGAHNLRNGYKTSKTAINSQSTTPYPDGWDVAKSSNHFMKIVNKFQNVFKKIK